MDALSDPDVQEVVWVAASQVGKTEVLNNYLGRTIDLDPAPILVVQPSLDMARVWSKDRLAPMIRDCKRLRGKVSEAKSRDAGNTTLHKTFPGGRLAIIGANSPAGLASRPIRDVLFDEVDRYPASAGTEGDPILLGEQRQRNFWNRKTFKVSSPGEKLSSRIWPEWEASDKRLYHLPCPHCDGPIVLDWKLVHWESEPGEDGTTVHHPETACVICPHCAAAIEEYDKADMLRDGEWIATNPGGRCPGFHISALYSPWVAWAELAELWVRVNATGDPEQLKTFINLQLGQPWEEADDSFEIAELGRAVETWPAEVPHGVGLITAGVDVQDDRLELVVKGWGAGEESWLITHQRIYGDPEQDEVWSELDHWLARAYRHQSGRKLYIQAAFVDSGFLQHRVFWYVHGREKRRVYASKGADSRITDHLIRAVRKNRDKVKPWTINTYHFKTIVFRRLRATASREPNEAGTFGGPGIMHFCRPTKTGADAEYFAQLGAEVPRRVRSGRAFVRIFQQVRERNEGFDLEVLVLCALYSLGEGTVERLADFAAKMSQPPDEPEPPGPPEPPAPRAPTKPTRGGIRTGPRRTNNWLGKWRRRI